MKPLKVLGCIFAASAWVTLMVFFLDQGRPLSYIGGFMGLSSILILLYVMAEDDKRHERKRK